MKKEAKYTGAVDCDAEKVLLYYWEYEAYGAKLYLFLYWCKDIPTFCLEGHLDYARVVQVAKGELCVTQESNGDFTCTANATITIFGEKLARFDAQVTSNVDWDVGVWQLKAYDIEVCGSNSSKLKCKVWKWPEEFKSNAKSPEELVIVSDDIAKDMQFLLSRPRGVQDIMPSQSDSVAPQFHDDSI